MEHMDIKVIQVDSVVSMVVGLAAATMEVEVEVVQLISAFQILHHIYLVELLLLVVAAVAEVLVMVEPVEDVKVMQMDVLQAMLSHRPTLELQLLVELRRVLLPVAH